MDLLSRIAKIEFFGVMPAGLYALVVLTFLGLAIHENGDARSLWVNGVSPVLEFLESHAIASAIAIILVSYILGSIPRLPPVNFTENPKQWWETRKRKRGSKFPYHDDLAANFNELQSKQNPTGPPDPSLWRGDVSMALFDFWKHTLCRESRDAYVYVKSLEARVRFFVGMCWAGSFGFVVNLFFVLPIWNHRPAWIFLGISGLLAVVFWFGVRRARREEASEVFLAYLALRGYPALPAGAALTMPSSPATPSPTTASSTSAPGATSTLRTTGST